MKITLAQINGIVGDLIGNTDKIISIINDHKGKSDLVVFPELSITNYPPLDLIEQSGFCDEQLKQLDRIAEVSNGIASVVGYFRPNTTGAGKPFFNSLALIYDGKIQYNYNKRLLPDYNIFNETRHFEPGIDVGICGFKGVKIGFLICEDAWNCKGSTTQHPLYAANPVEDTVYNQVDIIISINSSPSNVGKPEYRLEKFAAIAKKYKTPLIYVNQIGGNDDIVFDGTSFVVNANGTVAHTLPSFKEACETVDFDGKKFENLYGGIRPHPATIDDPNSYFYFQQIVLGIKDYARKCGFKKAVIASSGGVDSALVLALAVEALGSSNVCAITMPSAISSAGSVDDSVTLCENLGVKLYTYPIKDAFDTLMNGFDAAFEKSQKSLTKENLQARIRGMILMGYTNEFPGTIALNTGNKSEVSIGYFTTGGDGVGGLAVIGDLYKTEVWRLCHFLNKFKEKEIIPNVIINKEPSAELYPDQKDTDALPPYPVLDAVLMQYIEKNEIDPRIIEQCKKTIKDAGFTDETKIKKMVDRAEFKRRQIPHVIRVHQRAFGIGRRLPIAHGYIPK